jgi:hypothetical protein
LLAVVSVDIQQRCVHCQILLASSSPSLFFNTCGCVRPKIWWSRKKKVGITKRKVRVCDVVVVDSPIQSVQTRPFVQYVRSVADRLICSNVLPSLAHMLSHFFLFFRLGLDSFVVWLLVFHLTRVSCCLPYSFHYSVISVSTQAIWLET